MAYKKYEGFGVFKTKSKKVELYSETLKESESDALPIFREPPESPLSDPVLTTPYPLVLIAGVKEMAFYDQDVGSGARVLLCEVKKASSAPLRLD